MNEIDNDTEKRLRALTKRFAEGIAEVWQDVLKRWGISEPTAVLNECIEREEWFKGIVLSTAFFEGVGRRILENDLKGKIKPERLKNLGLEQIIMFLYALEKINETTYGKIMEIKGFRNDIVHLESFTEPEMQPEKAKKIIEKAIGCIEHLIRKFDEIEGNASQ